MRRWFYWKRVAAGMLTFIEISFKLFSEHFHSLFKCKSISIDALNWIQLRQRKSFFPLKSWYNLHFNEIFFHFIQGIACWWFDLISKKFSIYLSTIHWQHFKEFECMDYAKKNFFYTYWCVRVKLELNSDTVGCCVEPQTCYLESFSCKIKWYQVHIYQCWFLWKTLAISFIDECCHAYSAMHST